MVKAADLKPVLRPSASTSLAPTPSNSAYASGKARAAAQHKPKGPVPPDLLGITRLPYEAYCDSLFEVTDIWYCVRGTAQRNASQRRLTGLVGDGRELMLRLGLGLGSGLGLGLT
jgi:hypothetical protein